MDVAPMPDEMIPPRAGDDRLQKASPETDPTAALEYARRLFENVTAWYDAADTKAQVILTVNGAFIAFLSSTMFAEPAKMRALSGSFSPGTWVLLLLMSLCLAGSIGAALACLWSRLYSNREVDEIFRQLGVVVGESASYKPDVLWFFQLVPRLDPTQFQARLLQVDEADEVSALAFQISALSANVTRKHRWVNAGFVLAGLSFVLFLAAGMSYLASV
ncbi:MAG TPA: Pycsar system effector family protein [Longimicrobium sp.]